MHLLPRLAVVALLGCASSSPTPAAAPPAPAATPTVPTAFRVEVSGHGPPMILIPGLAASGETWTTTVEHLRDRYTCHVLTLAGFAGVPPVPPPLLPTVKTALARYVVERRMERPVIVGHGFGGSIALDVAADRPELVGPLVIVDQLPFAGIMAGLSSAEQARPIADRLRAETSGQTQAQWEAFARSGAFTKPMVTSPTDHERLIAWDAASDHATVTDAFASLLVLDLRPRLAQITSPVLVIGTWIAMREHVDRKTVLKAFREQYAELARMHFAMTDTARLFVMFDDSPWFIAQLDGFLADPGAAVRDRGFAKE